MIRGLGPNSRSSQQRSHRQPATAPVWSPGSTPAVSVGRASASGPRLPSPASHGEWVGYSACRFPQGGRHTALLAARSLRHEEKQQDLGSCSHHPRASVCGAGMCSAGPVQAQRRPLAIWPPRLLCIPSGVRERSSPRDLEKTGVGGPSGAAAGSKETLEDTLLPRRFPESKSHFPGRRATEKAPASPSREPVTLSLAEPDTHFPAQSLPSAA